MKTLRCLAAFASLVAVVSNAPAWAQAAGTATSGSIWGKVTDETGSVLPGVTVSLSSPALLGGATTVTNEQGVYRFPSLPPGDFAVRFELAGFRTVVREGILLTLAFTSTLNVEMRVASVEETIVVTGESPMVDSVNAQVRTSFNKEMLASLPSARDMWSILAETPAVMMSRIDVGGNTAGTQTSYTAYGISGQTKPVVEGVIGLESSGAVGFYYDYGSFEEVNIGAAGQGAEMATPGVQSVFISKSGGNEYHGDFYADYESRALESTNIDADQLAKGVRAGSNRIHLITDLNPNAGGYLKKDRIWWFGSYRRQDIQVRNPNFPPRPFETEINDYTGKLTYQLPRNNRLVAYIMYGIKKQPYRTLAFVASNAIYPEPEYTWNQYNPGYVWKMEWNRAFSNNVFVEARVGRWVDDWGQSRYTDEPRREDLVTGIVTGGSRNWKAFQDRPQTTGAISYFKDGWAGSHNIKVGWEIQKDDRRELWKDAFPGNLVHVLRQGAPVEVYLLLAPLNSDNRLYWNGLYFSDTWTTGRFSINAGLRYDHYRSAYPDQERPANDFAPGLSVSGVDNLITWNVLGPRIGVSWDIAGTARDVVKATYGRYYINPTRQVADVSNPNTSPQWSRYTWVDSNGDKVWQRGEERTLLGTRGGVATGSFDPNLKDAFNDQVTLWYERSMPYRLVLRTGFVYNRTSREFQTVNALRPYSAYNIPVTRVDPGVDAVTGTADDGVLNLFNLDPSLVGLTLNQLINTTGYASRARTWEIAATRRFSGRWSAQVSYARTWEKENAFRTNPNQAPPVGYLGRSTFKVTGSFDPGWGLRFSPILRYQEGTYFARSVSVSLNYGSTSIQAEPTGSRQRDDILLFDLRSERSFKLPGKTTVGLFVDVFNIFNSNAVTALTTTTGSSFLRPTGILPPRVMKLGTKFSW